MSTTLSFRPALADHVIEPPDLGVVFRKIVLHTEGMIDLDWSSDGVDFNTERFDFTALAPNQIIHYESGEPLQFARTL